MSFAVGTYAEASFASGASPNVLQQVELAAATGAVGSVTVVANANTVIVDAVDVPAFRISSAVGSVTVVADSNLSLTGVQGTLAVGSVTAKANAKTSGKAKLKAGEALTDAEIAALFGA